MKNITSFKDLTVWQKSMDLTEDIYRLTNRFPKDEIYGLTSQIRRCSVSIPSNIAEGFLRGHTAEYRQFLRIAYGSGAELETQLLIALRIGHIKKEQFEKINELLIEIMKMLNKLLFVLSTKP
ncbi:MAG TPA: four helix bundle protein [Candidatus Saccharimonadales bacterium]|nr:four helix bundle protein [Candidatus Saccharimonadales bacterium]